MAIHHEESKFRKFVKVAFLFILGIFVISWLFDGFVGEELLGDNILIIPIHGEISLSGGGSFLSPGGLTSDEVVDLIEEANEDDRISAIILEINSPGGTVVATRDIATAIESSEKPVVS